MADIYTLEEDREVTNLILESASLLSAACAQVADRPEAAAILDRKRALMPKLIATLDKRFKREEEARRG